MSRQNWRTCVLLTVGEHMNFMMFCDDLAVWNGHGKFEIGQMQPHCSPPPCSQLVLRCSQDQSRQSFLVCKTLFCCLRAWLEQPHRPMKLPVLHTYIKNLCCPNPNSKVKNALANLGRQAQGRSERNHVHESSKVDHFWSTGPRLCWPLALLIGNFGVLPFFQNLMAPKQNTVQIDCRLPRVGVNTAWHSAKHGVPTVPSFTCPSCYPGRFLLHPQVATQLTTFLGIDTYPHISRSLENHRIIISKVPAIGWDMLVFLEGNRLHTPLHMDVSENSGTPKSSILIGFSIINHPFWGTPIFGNTHIRTTWLRHYRSVAGRTGAQQRLGNGRHDSAREKYLFLLGRVPHTNAMNILKRFIWVDFDIRSNCQQFETAKIPA